MIVRSEFVRPIVLALALTVLGEVLIFGIWGVLLFPEGNLLRKLGWTLTCGVAMGAAIGALVNVVVTGRLTALRAVLGQCGPV